MVLVFKTSVQDWRDVEEMRPVLDKLIGRNGVDEHDAAIGLDAQPPRKKWSFDLEDCDRVLRVETNSLSPEEINHVLRTAGFDCEELEDVVVVCK